MRMRSTLTNALGVLAATLVWGCGDGRPPEPASTAATAATATTPTTATLRYRVTGMHCDGCAEAIVAEVAEVKGVRSIECAFATKTAVVTLSDDAARPEVERAITKLGYQIAPADDAAQAPPSK